MKRLLFLPLLVLLAVPAFGQGSAIGFQLGVSQVADNGIEFDFDDQVKEVFFSTDLEPGSAFKIKAGRVETTRLVDDEGTLFEEEGDLDYIDALIEYRFYEVYGSTSLFAGPGAYRQRFETGEDETDFGFSVGVAGLFPVTRRLGVVAELAYHWVNFEDSRELLTATGGVRIGF